MGYYHSVAFKLPVLKTAPLPVLEFFDKVFHRHESDDAFKNLLSHGDLTHYKTTVLFDSNNPVMSDMDYFGCMLSGHNAYFEAWYQNIKEETENIILYETYHSCKYPRSEFTLHLLNGLLPALDLKEGDIVYRTVGEEGCKETIIYLKEGVLVLSDDADGWAYDGDNDPDHPYNDTSKYGFPPEPEITDEMRNSRDDVSFNLPWNVHELKTQLAIEENKRGGDVPW